ncbi:hypothetical protein [Flavihumibacter sp.]
MPDPFDEVGMRNAGKVSFSLCNNWKAGANTLVIDTKATGSA